MGILIGLAFAVNLNEIPLVAFNLVRMILAAPQELASYARLLKCAKESAGKIKGSSGSTARV